LCDFGHLFGRGIQNGRQIAFWSGMDTDMVDRAGDRAQEQPG
jgi:hypothetical protein